jgi:hypothetical protein
MQITCFNCQTIWEVPEKTLHDARLKYKSGQKDYEFSCPNCGAKNELTEDEFRSSDQPQIVVPATGTEARPGPIEDENSSRTDVSATEAPTNPVEAPKPELWQRRGIVRVRGLEAHQNHSNWSEVMAKLSRGDRVTILDTWTDGESTWVQLGPERWVNVEQDGEASIELISD